MTLELVKKIKEIIEAYHAITDLCAAEIKKAFEELNETPNKYTPEYTMQAAKTAVDTAIGANEKNGMVLNQKLKLVIADAKKQVLPMLYEKPKAITDKAVLVNNALQLLQIEGTEITDDVAFDILKEFIDDYEQMKVFKRVIGKHVELETAIGTSTFPKTFGKYNKIETALNTFNEVESIANGIFLHKKGFGERYVVNLQTFTIPVDGYGQIQDEDAIINYSTIIEKIAENNDFFQEVPNENPALDAE